MVYFVGAGTGAPDLITVRGMRYLEQADVIIYAGSLVNPELLSYAKESCEIYNSAQMTLEEVLAVMEEAEREGEKDRPPPYGRSEHLRSGTGTDGCFGSKRDSL